MRTDQPGGSFFTTLEWAETLLDRLFSGRCEDGPDGKASLQSERLTSVVAIMI
jgi:hypothetical protein